MCNIFHTTVNPRIINAEIVYQLNVQIINHFLHKNINVNQKLKLCILPKATKGQVPLSNLSNFSG